MTDPAMLPAIKASIRANEIGSQSPYKLSFAKKGNSGASYGVFQNDTYANRTALTTLTQILSDAGLPADQVQRITGLLGRPCPTNPLSASDEAAVNAALAAPDGQAQVDTLDSAQLQIVTGYLDQALAASIAPVNGDAQLAICLWCNMTGKPTTLMTWLGGASVTQAGGTVAPPGNPVTMDDMTRYLLSTQFFVQNPGNWPHFTDSVAAGVPLLPS
jgi:hypothetical protein